MRELLIWLANFFPKTNDEDTTHLTDAALLEQLRNQLDKTADEIDACFLPGVSEHILLEKIGRAADQVRRARGIANHRLVA